MLPLRVRVYLRAIVIKRYSIFYKPPGLKPHHQIVLCHIPDTCLRQSYPSVEIQVVWLQVLACIISKRFYPDFYHPFSTFSMYRIPFKMTMDYIFLSINWSFFYVGVSQINSCFGLWLCTCIKNIHHSQFGDHPSIMLAIKRTCYHETQIYF